MLGGLILPTFLILGGLSARGGLKVNFDGYVQVRVPGPGAA
jgi:hypothetical protein